MWIVLEDPNLPRNICFAEFGDPWIAPMEPIKKSKMHGLSKTLNPNACLVSSCDKNYIFFSCDPILTYIRV